MILAILPDASKAEALVNNLSEAEFDLKDVSVLMQDATTRNKILPDAGPFQGVVPEKLSGALKKAGLSEGMAAKCDDAIQNGKVVVSMKVDPKYQQAALEMFKDMSAEILEE